MVGALLLNKTRCEYCGRFMAKDTIQEPRPKPHGIFYICNNCGYALSMKQLQKVKWRRPYNQQDAHCLSFVILKEGCSDYNVQYRMKVIAREEREREREPVVLQ